MSKRNKSRPFSLSYIDVSPSKRRSLHKIKKTIRHVRPTLAAHSATVSSSKSGERNTLDAVEPETSLASSGAGVDVFDQNIDIDSDDLSDDLSAEPQSSYSKRQQKAASNWSEVRDQLLHATVESSVPSGVFSCVVCQEKADIVCLDCGPHAYYCIAHVESVHLGMNIFHMPQVWRVSCIICSCI